MIGSKCDVLQILEIQKKYLIYQVKREVEFKFPLVLTKFQNLHKNLAKKYN